MDELHSVTKPPSKSHTQPTLSPIFSHSLIIHILTYFSLPYMHSHSFPHTFTHLHSVSFNPSVMHAFKLHPSDVNNKLRNTEQFHKDPL
jgi:hypothetical protein